MVEYKIISELKIKVLPVQLWFKYVVRYYITSNLYVDDELYNYFPLRIFIAKLFMYFYTIRIDQKYKTRKKIKNNKEKRNAYI